MLNDHFTASGTFAVTEADGSSGMPVASGWVRRKTSEFAPIVHKLESLCYKVCSNYAPFAPKNCLFNNRVIMPFRRAHNIIKFATCAVKPKNCQSENKYEIEVEFLILSHPQPIFLSTAWGKLKTENPNGRK